jgi:hypothetical protein
VLDGGFGLSDPDRFVPWPIWRDGACAATTPLPAGYTCPAPDRVLTGWDFDIESMAVPDPADVGHLGPFVTFPFVTIESVDTSTPRR